MDALRDDNSPPSLLADFLYKPKHNVTFTLRLCVFCFFLLLHGDSELSFHNAWLSFFFLFPLSPLSFVIANHI